MASTISRRQTSTRPNPAVLARRADALAQLLRNEGRLALALVAANIAAELRRPGVVS